MPDRTPSSSWRRRALIGLAGVLAAVLVVVSVQRIMERRQERAHVEAMSERLREMREALERCRAQLVREEEAFQRFDRTLDSLRARVDAYVSQDGRVPEEEYEAYMETFDRYNEAVPEWEARADSLQAREARCRARIEAHNVLADSLRAEMDLPGSS